jgi:peptidoglycan/LPS O-acetylase OafA/YrhL
MGLLRLINDQLEITINGYLAVVCFFIISGFYMSMVLNETYASRGRGVLAFYENRMLRLFPTYWVVAASVLGFWLISNPSFIALPSFIDHPFVSVFTVFANVFIFGLDALVLQSDWAHLDGIRLVGPAWSLSIELQFYLFAPFVVRRSLPVCLAALAVALFVRLFYLGSEFDPWRYFYSPTVFVFFLMGHVSHRLSVNVQPDTRRLIGYCAVVVVPIFAYLAQVQKTEDLDRIELWIFYIVFAAAVPYMFELTRRCALDGIMGNISYPLYLVHQPLFIAVAFSLGASPPYKILSIGTGTAIATAILAILLAIALRAFLEIPIDRFRERVKINNSRKLSGDTSIA